MPKINHLSSTYLISLVGLTKSNYKVISLLRFLRQNDPKCVPDYALKKYVKTINDKWICYDSKFGFFLEFLDKWVCSVTFNLSAQSNANYETHLFQGELHEELSGIHTRSELIQRFGPPLKPMHGMDQYHLANNLIFGVVYDHDDPDRILCISYGTKKIFSNPKYFPNRFSQIFCSLYDLPDDDDE